MVSGPPRHRVGVTFHSTTDSRYYLSLRNDHYYELRYSAPQFEDAVLGVTSTDVIRPNDWNKLTVLTRGNRLYFYVNDRYMAQVQDDHATRGQIGIVYGVDDAEPAVFEFRKLEVRAAGGK
jgi:hypothetical protein